MFHPKMKVNSPFNGLKIYNGAFAGNGEAMKVPRHTDFLPALDHPLRQSKISVAARPSKMELLSVECSNCPSSSTQSMLWRDAM